MNATDYWAQHNLRVAKRRKRLAVLRAVGASALAALVMAASAYVAYLAWINLPHH